MILIPVMINEPVDWYKDHSYLATDTAIDIGVIMFSVEGNLLWDGTARLMLLNFLCKVFMEEKIMEQNPQI